MKQRNAAFQSLYEQCFQKVERFIEQNKGTSEDARDVFQEGVVILFQNIATQKFKGDSAPGTYLFSICKNVWLQALRKRKEEVDLDQVQRPEELEALIDVSLVRVLLDELNASCRKLLQGFYFEKKSMKELMAEFNVGSLQAIKNKKLGCMKVVMNIVRQKRVGHDRFIQ